MYVYGKLYLSLYANWKCAGQWRPIPPVTCQPSQSFRITCQKTIPAILTIGSICELINEQQQCVSKQHGPLMCMWSLNYSKPIPMPEKRPGLRELYQVPQPHIAFNYLCHDLVFRI